MKREKSNFNNIIIYLMFISILYVFLSINYVKIVIYTIYYIVSSLNLIFIISFVLTFIYQTLIQFIRNTTRKNFFLVYSIFLLSIIIPLTAAYYSNNKEIALEYITYILFNNTLIPPIISLISLFREEKDYKNPLKMILLFTVIAMNALILKVTLDLQLAEIGEIQINKLGISELNLLLSYVAMIQSAIFGTAIEQNKFQPIVTDYSLYYVLPIVIFCSFVYALKAIVDNLKIYDDEFYYKETIETNHSHPLSRIAMTTFLSVISSIIILYASQYLIETYGIHYSNLVLIIPLSMCIIIAIVARIK